MSNNLQPAYDLVLQSSASATGNGTAMAVGGFTGVTIQVNTTFVATVTPQGTVDGVYTGLQAINMATGVAASTITAAGTYYVPLAGIDLFRAPITAYTSGSVTVTAKAVLGPPPVVITALQSASTLGTINQGTGAAVANYWPVRLTDGTNASPSMDAAARPGFQKITDGTNTMPTMDVTARRGWVQPSDGTNDFKSGSAANIAATSAVNAQLVTPPGQWSVTHAPSSATQATASKSAGSAGVRHVATGCIITVVAGASAPTAALVTVNLRDGATGAGTILATFTLAIAAVAGQCNPLAITGLNIPGTAATAMTLETSAATGTNVSASVTLTGYDAV